MIAKMIEDLIKDVVRKTLEDFRESGNVSEPADIIETDNLAEVIEKLAILHCRMWHLEDRIAEHYEDDNWVADMKRKIDICFKEKRPMYVQAINRMVDKAIKEGKSLVSDSVKVYKRYE